MSNQVGELVLSNTGVTLADVSSVSGEVLMGTLRWEKGNDARRTRAAAQNGSNLREQGAELALAESNARGPRPHDSVAGPAFARPRRRILGNLSARAARRGVLEIEPQ